MPDDLQPDEGQGDAGSTGIFDPYLQAVPEEARDAVAGYLKDAEKNVNQRISQASELEKTFGPYKDVDLSNYDPETLNQLLAWHQQVSADPDAYRQFVEAEAREMGITPAEAEEVIAAEEELNPEQMQQQVQQLVEERLAPLQQGLTEIQEREQTDLEFNAIQGARHEIELKLGRELEKQEWADIIDLGMPLAVTDDGRELPMGDASWVMGGYERLEGLYGTGSKLFLDDKQVQPAGALKAGGTPALKPITEFKDANAALRERLRQPQS